MEPIRITTVHPALVHFTLGTLPVLVIAYLLAAVRRSHRFTFAGDVTAVVTAIITLATVAFGLVSNALVEWPGGLGTWRWLHLAFGITSGVALVAFAGVRLWWRRKSPVSGMPTAYAALIMSLLIGFTGWIGGEVLVFHSGVAVKAAGEGALAPPLDADREQPPEDLEHAMHRIRADWAAVDTALASAVVQEPSKQRFDTVAQAATRIADTAHWIAENRSEGEHDHEHGAGLDFMAGRLEQKASALAEAARKGELPAVARANGELTATCAGCHQSFRWGAEHAER